MRDPDAIALGVARNVHALRTRRSWTLDALAARSGVSKGMLVQIEQARTNPSIGTLCRIADALGVSLPRLVEVDELPPVRVVRAADAPELWHGLEGSAGTLLVGTAGAEHAELWDWRMAPGDSYEGAQHPPGAREMLYVLSGALTLDLGAESHVIGKGDTLLFRADRPHTYSNASKTLLRFIMVSIEPSRARP
jgi:transcriptional regulator with XRE-family HTH domain